MKRIVIAAAAWAAFLCPAQAQIPGQFPAGALYGNPTGAQAPPRAALPGDFGIQLASVTTNVPITPTTPIGAGGTWTSSCFPATGNDRIDFAATLSQSGTLKINRYLGAACTVPIPGGPIQQSATTAVPGVVSASDGAALRGYTVEITNTTGVASNVTNSALLQTTSSSQTGNPAYTDALGNQTQPVTPMCNGAECSMANPLYTAGINSTQGGEFHIGEIGQNQITVTTNLTNTAVSYLTGIAIGDLLTLPGMVRLSEVAGSPGTGGQILATMLSFQNAVTTPIDVVYFNANPTASTCTNNSTFALSNADRNKVIGIARVTDFMVATPSAIGQLGGFPMPYVLNLNTNGYACIVARATTLTLTGGASLIVRVIRQ